MVNIPVNAALPIVHTLPDEFGVVCYNLSWNSGDVRNLSCVKVR